jgi:hypothetical protein
MLTFSTQPPSSATMINIEQEERKDALTISISVTGEHFYKHVDVREKDVSSDRRGREKGLIGVGAG